MASTQRQRYQPSAPLWSRALTYIGFDAVAAEQALARWQERRIRADRPKRRSRTGHGVVAVIGYGAAGLTVLGLAVAVLLAADRVTRIVGDAERSSEAAVPSETAVAAAPEPAVLPSPRSLDRQLVGAREVVPLGAEVPNPSTDLLVGPLTTGEAVPSTAPPPSIPAAIDVPVLGPTAPPVTTAAPTTAAPTTAPPTTAPPVTTIPLVTSAPPTTVVPTTPRSCIARYVVTGQYQGWLDARVDVTAGASDIGSWTVSWINGADQRVTYWWGATVTESGSSVAATGDAVAGYATTQFGVSLSGTATATEGYLACNAL